MNGFGLAYKGTPVAMLPGAKINWTFEDDLFEFDSIGQGYSWPITLPREGNEHIFFFAGDPDNPDNLLKTWDGFQITFGGNVWWDVSFDLTDADGEYYEGSLTTVNGKLFESLGKKLRDIIPDSELIPLPAGTLESAITPFNEAMSSDYRFPYFTFYNRNYSGMQIANAQLGFMSVAIGLLFLVEKTLSVLGIKLDNLLTQTNDDNENLIILTNRIIHNAPLYDKRLNQYLPEITLSELLNDLIFYTGCSLSVTKVNTDLQIRSFDRDRKSRAIVVDADLIQPVRANDINVELSYNLSDDDRLHDGTLEILEGDDVGEYATIEDWEAATHPEGAYAYIRNMNAYYKMVTDLDLGLVSRFYSYPYQSYQTTGKTKKISLSPAMIPCGKDKYVFTELEGSFNIINNGSGYVRITGFQNDNERPTTAMEIKWIENGDRWYDDFDFLTIDESNPDYIDVATPFTDKVSISKLILREEQPYYIPQLSGDIHNSRKGILAEGFKGRVAYYHGMVDTIDEMDTYPYASCDPYDKDGDLISQTSMRLTDEDYGIPFTFWQSVLSVMQSSKLIKIKTWLSAHLIDTIIAHKIIRVGNQLVRIFKIETELADDGTSHQDIEGTLL